MSFYLKPPKGQINLCKLKECIKQRLSCYDSLYNNSVEISNFDCLIEDSILDRTGHYLFRLLACSNSTFCDVFLRNEQKLLLLRLNTYDKRDVRRFLKTTLRQSKDLLQEVDVDERVAELCTCLFEICCDMLRIEYSKHVFEDDHFEDCCQEFTLKVPFWFCASLLSNREIVVSNGFAIIPCQNWKKLLLSVYHTYIARVLQVMKCNRNVDMTLQDVRIREALKLVKNYSFEDSITSNHKSKFDISKIDVDSKLFPLCMLNLYKVLEKANRLSHNDRVDFSLYMKDIGISLSDSLNFWKTAYSKQHTSCSYCTHDWQKNEKRYIYGIRHLYGLEGSRRNYKAKSCQYMQEKSLSAAETGGCPFRHFDDANLREALRKVLSNRDDEVEVMIYERNENPSNSCKIFYEIVSETLGNRTVDGTANFKDPVEYYLSLKGETSDVRSTNYS